METADPLVILKGVDVDSCMLSPEARAVEMVSLLYEDGRKWNLPPESYYAVGCARLAQSYITETQREVLVALRAIRRSCELEGESLPKRNLVAALSAFGAAPSAEIKPIFELTGDFHLGSEPIVFVSMRSI